MIFLTKYWKNFDTFKATGVSYCVEICYNLMSDNNLVLGHWLCEEGVLDIINSLYCSLLYLRSISM